MSEGARKIGVRSDIVKARDDCRNENSPRLMGKPRARVSPMFRFLQALWPSRPESDAGARGEQLAAEWLRRERNFAIIIRNWRSPRDRREEIDLVARDGDVLVFVEVKARAAGALVPGYHAIDARKKRVLRRAIDAYLGQLREKPRTFRFDVVEVSFPVASKQAVSSHAGARAGPADAGAAAEPEVLHFENVPLFSKYFRG